jgi:hypothetical protein
MNNGLEASNNTNDEDFFGKDVHYHYPFMDIDIKKLTNDSIFTITTSSTSFTTHSYHEFINEYRKMYWDLVEAGEIADTSYESTKLIDSLRTIGFADYSNNLKMRLASLDKTRTDIVSILIDEVYDTDDIHKAHNDEELDKLIKQYTYLSSHVDKDKTHEENTIIEAYHYWKQYHKDKQKQFDFTMSNTSHPFYR